jgi:1-aminocyclopropane-1-carboxylate deaminase/D-cysteine desulfhydrase-like pyridoxal-dependent ACC family enzyme
MKPVLVLRGDAPQSYQGNLLLDKLFGAELEFLDPEGYFTQIEGAMNAHAAAAEARGEKALIIPLGVPRRSAHWATCARSKKWMPSSKNAISHRRR